MLLTHALMMFPASASSRAPQAPERGGVGGGLSLFSQSLDRVVNRDTFAKQIRVPQPEVPTQLPEAVLCQAVCGSRKRGK